MTATLPYAVKLARSGVIAALEQDAHLRNGLGLGREFAV
jgi:alanine dehydrogenase